MAVIGAKGNFAGPGGAFEEEKKREIVCNKVWTGNLRKNMLKSMFAGARGVSSPADQSRRDGSHFCQQAA